LGQSASADAGRGAKRGRYPGARRHRFIKDLDLAAPGCGDRIVGLESAEKWNFPHLDKLWLAQ